MFSVGTYVMTAKDGICRIEEITQLDFSGKLKDYYVLIPIKNLNARSYIPLEIAESKMRYLITKEEAYDVIDKMPAIEDLQISCEKNREAEYKEAIRSCEPSKVISVIKGLYHRISDREKRGKKIYSIDERYYKMAFEQLRSELAYVIGCNQDELEELIHNKICA